MVALKVWSAISLARLIAVIARLEESYPSAILVLVGWAVVISRNDRLMASLRLPLPSPSDATRIGSLLEEYLVFVVVEMMVSNSRARHPPTSPAAPTNLRLY